MKINLLLCDTFTGFLPPEIPSYASMFENLFRSVLNTFQLQTYLVMEGVLPTTIRNDELYLITGCNRSVYDNIHWIKNLLHWICKAYYAKAHVTGICFGHQAIAQALGGCVEKFSGGWGIGIRESSILDSELKEYFHGKKMHLLYNHHDQVTKLPCGAVSLATSDFCTNEAFRIGNYFLAFQGHPEYTSEYELHLLKNHAANENDSVKRLATESIQKFTAEGQLVAQYIVNQMN